MFFLDSSFRFKIPIKLEKTTQNYFWEIRGTYEKEIFENKATVEFLLSTLCR
jgi:hypothetical protein